MADIVVHGMRGSFVDAEDGLVLHGLAGSLSGRAAGGQTAVLGLATETDTAFALVVPQAAVLGLALETDSAFAIISPQIAVLGLATETDTAFAMVGGVVSLTTLPITRTNGVVRSSEAGWSATILNAARSSIVEKQVSLTTNASGELVLTNASVVLATVYWVVPVQPDGLYGNAERITAALS